MSRLLAKIDFKRLLPTGRKATDIYRALEQAVNTGDLAADQQLPTVRALSELLGVNKNTVSAAYKMLLENGVILTDGRRGSVVARRQLDGPASTAFAVSTGQAVPVHDGNPDPAFLPTRPELLAAFAALNLATPRLYGEQRNVPALLDWARDAFAADGLLGTDIFVSGGALDALDRALRTQLKPGDKVALEDPGYGTVMALVRALGLRPVPLASDASGIVPASLAAALGKGCRAVLFSNRAQNPTGIAITAARAQELRALVPLHPEVLFLDDDHSSLLNLAPYEAWHNAATRWLTVRSFSKFLGPDLRVAVSTGDGATLAKLAYAQATSMGWVSSLLQQLVVHLLLEPQVRARIALAGRTYQQRFTQLRTGLEALGLPVPGQAGLNLWVPVPDVATTMQALLAKGWVARSGVDFCLQSPPGIRLTSARLSTEQIQQLLAALRESMISTRNTSMA
jgi:DNA-binding transcriptional MocR family regulator